MYFSTQGFLLGWRGLLPGLDPPRMGVSELSTEAATALPAAPGPTSLRPRARSLLGAHSTGGKRPCCNSPPYAATGRLTACARYLQGVARRGICKHFRFTESTCPPCANCLSGGCDGE